MPSNSREHDGFAKVEQGEYGELDEHGPSSSPRQKELYFATAFLRIDAPVRRFAPSFFARGLEAILRRLVVASRRAGLGFAAFFAAGFLAAVLRAAGLRAAGFLAAVLRAAGFLAAALLAGALRAGAFLAAVLRAAGFFAADLALLTTILLLLDVERRGMPWRDSVPLTNILQKSVYDLLSKLTTWSI
ncbi:MAG TPA: hypothetical protein VKZ79_07670 [Alphaproteobacteria bacterium]|nr:hypothetical protein [Alphaproteobacteria bacterium]